MTTRGKWKQPTEKFILRPTPLLGVDILGVSNLISFPSYDFRFQFMADMYVALNDEGLEGEPPQPRV